MGTTIPVFGIYNNSYHLVEKFHQVYQIHPQLKLGLFSVALFWNPIILHDNTRFAFINIDVNYVYIRINRQTMANHSYLSSFSQLNIDNFFYPQTAKSNRITYASDNSHNFITCCSILLNRFVAK